METPGNKSYDFTIALFHDSQTCILHSVSHRHPGSGVPQHLQVDVSLSQTLRAPNRNHCHYSPYSNGLTRFGCPGSDPWSHSSVHSTVTSMRVLYFPHTSQSTITKTDPYYPYSTIFLSLHISHENYCHDSILDLTYRPLLCMSEILIDYIITYTLNKTMPWTLNSFQQIYYTSQGILWASGWQKLRVCLFKDLLILEHK